MIEQLQQRWPEHYAMDWDNVGLLVGDKEQEVHHVLIALDVTDEAIDQAVKMGADMIVTHHPMIFSPLKKITTDDFIACRVMKLIKNNICYYAMHTNFDVMGMAELNVKALQLRETDVLEVTYRDENGTEGIGRVGNLPEDMSLEKFADYVKAAFDLSSVRIYGNPHKRIRRVAVCSGSGKGEVREVLSSGADVYVTGDVDHHMGIDAAAQGLAVIDAGHYGTEMIFISYMQSELAAMFPALTVSSVEVKQPFIIK